jgi:hypothetical protein
VFLVLKVFNCLLDQILGVTIVLILADGGGDVIREVLIEHFVNGGRAGCLGVKKTHLFGSHSRAEIIYPQQFKEARLNGITFIPGGRHFQMFAINEISKVGGDDCAVGGGIRNEEPVVMSGPWRVKLPTHSRMFTTYAGGWQVIFVALRRCLRGCRPSSLVLFIFVVSPVGGGVKGPVIDGVTGHLLFDLCFVSWLSRNLSISTHSTMQFR